MRLAGIERGGFYPFPPHMAEATASWFIPLPAGSRGRLLDPCAGEGEIARLLGKLLNCETMGCELSAYLFTPHNGQVPPGWERYDLQTPI
jgi:hypothetical protein